MFLTYTVDLSIPCCTCRYFMRHKLPCKHFFAIFRFFSERSLARLPKEYTEGPLLSLHRDIPAAPSDWDTSCTSDAGMDCDATDAAPTVAELPKTVRETSKKTRRLLTDALHRIASAIMCCKDEDKKGDAYQHLQQAYKILVSGCPSLIEWLGHPRLPYQRLFQSSHQLCSKATSLESTATSSGSHRKLENTRKGG